MDLMEPKYYICILEVIRHPNHPPTMWARIPREPYSRAFPSNPCMAKITYIYHKESTIHVGKYTMTMDGTVDGRNPAPPNMYDTL